MKQWEHAYIYFFSFCLPPGILPVVGPTERWCCLQHLARPYYVALGQALICGWTQNLITLCIVHRDGVTTMGCPIHLSYPVQLLLCTLVEKFGFEEQPKNYIDFHLDGVLSRIYLFSAKYFSDNILFFFRQYFKLWHILHTHFGEKVNNEAHNIKSFEGILN